MTWLKDSNTHVNETTQDKANQVDGVVRCDVCGDELLEGFSIFNCCEDCYDNYDDLESVLVDNLSGL